MESLIIISINLKYDHTPKYSNMNPTFNTDKTKSFQTPNALENSSQNLKEPNHFSWSNLATQVGKDKIEDSEKITLHCLPTSMGNSVNISLISSSLEYFVDVKSHEFASDTVNGSRRRWSMIRSCTQWSTSPFRKSLHGRRSIRVPQDRRQLRHQHRN